MRRTAIARVTLTALLLTSAHVWTAHVGTARADDDERPPVGVTLEPWAAFDGVDRPFRYIATIRNETGAPLEVALDRRLLSFEIRPSEGRGRRRRCRHPDAPRRTPDDRVRSLAPGEEHREWIDLRMYCWGRALDTLEDGADVEGRYGWRRRTRRRWIAGATEASWRDRTGGVELMPFSFLGIPDSESATERLGEAAEGGEGEGEAPPVEVDLTSRSVRRAGYLTFRPSVRAHEGSERLYVRPDAWRFRVHTPGGGRVGCRIPAGGGSPPPDLYRRVTERRAARELLDADAFCPPDTFEQAGIYEVEPILHLAHSGEEWGYEAVTGRFRGPATPFRITHGEAGYVEQIPEPGGDGDGEEDRQAALAP